MRDKERIEVYVSELPANCKECPMCRSGGVKINKNGRYKDAQSCVLGSYHKYQTIDDKIDTCPLKTIQSVKNEKVVEALERVKQNILKHEDIYYQENSPFVCVVNLDIESEINKVIKEYGGENVKD